MNKSWLDYHIVIVGGGIVGLTLAALLAKSNLKIAILEQTTFPHSFQPSSYDIRVSAINRASENIFRHLTIWKTIENRRISPYKKMHIWNENNNAKLDFNCTEINEPDLGHIIENQVIFSALKNFLDDYTDNIILYPQFQINDVQFYSDHGTLTDTKNRKLTFQLIVGADGKNSWLRNKINIPLEEKNYQQTALVAQIKTEKPHQKTAYQRFLTTGPLAFLPLADPHHSSIVWSTTPEHAESLKNASKEEFEKQLCFSFESLLGKVTLLSSLHSFPLHYQHAKYYIQKRVAFIGDAAHTIHPLAGLGLNLGLLDAACLAENLLHAISQQRDFGLEKTLKRYELQQRSYNTVTLNTINFLKSFFSQENTTLSLLQNISLNLINKIPFTKKTLSRYALGTLGDLPAIAKIKL